MEIPKHALKKVAVFEIDKNLYNFSIWVLHNLPAFTRTLNINNWWLLPFYIVDGGDALSSHELEYDGAHPLPPSPNRDRMRKVNCDQLFMCIKW